MSTVPVDVISAHPLRQFLSAAMERVGTDYHEDIVGISQILDRVLDGKLLEQ